MDDLELWDLASHAAEPLRGEVLERLAADAAQRERVAALLAQPAPPLGEGPRYEIVGLVGAGTQADVYQARRLDLDRACALKVFRSISDPGFVDRVRREAGLMARVLSPHVVTVFDAGDLGDGRYFIEMALCAEPDPEGAPGSVALGRSLRAHVVERGPLPPDEAARLLQPVCAAVAAAHRAGVVHSDVKPENVLVLPVSRRAMLADFGIAGSLAQRATAGAGEPAAPAGSLPYMAPEQLDGRSPPDAASDVYGLGGTLLFALSGQAPHPCRGAAGDPRQGARRPVPAGVPRALAEIVERALAPDPSDRPGAEELASALDAFLARRPTPWDLDRPRRRLALFYQRHRTLLNLAFAGAVLAATLGLGLLRAVVAKTGLQHRGDALARQVHALDADVARLGSQKGALESELARLRLEREAIAGAEAREREARARAEGRSSEADAQLTAATALARDATARLERAREAADQLEARLAEATARGERLGRELAAREADLRAGAERYQASIDALRARWELEAGQLRGDLEGEREAAAALQRRFAEADRERAAAVQARAELDARWQGKLEAARAEREDLRRQLEAERSRKAIPPAVGAPPAADASARTARSTDPR